MPSLQFSRCWGFCSRLRGLWDRTGSPYEALGAWPTDAFCSSDSLFSPKDSKPGLFLFSLAARVVLVWNRELFLILWDAEAKRSSGCAELPLGNGPHPVHRAGNGLGGVISHKYLWRFGFVLLCLASTFTPLPQIPGGFFTSVTVPHFPLPSLLWHQLDVAARKGRQISPQISPLQSTHPGRIPRPWGALGAGQDVCSPRLP